MSGRPQPKSHLTLQQLDRLVAAMEMLQANTAALSVDYMPAPHGRVLENDEVLEAMRQAISARSGGSAGAQAALGEELISYLELYEQRIADGHVEYLEDLAADAKRPGPAGQWLAKQSIAMDYLVTRRRARTIGARWKHPEIINSHGELMAEIRLYELFLKRHEGERSHYVRDIAQRRNWLARCLGHEVARAKLADQWGAHGLNWRGKLADRRYKNQVRRTLGL